MPRHATEDELTDKVTTTQLAGSMLPAQPRIRVEKNATPLTLSTTWQRIAFGDSNSLNANTFPTEQGNNTQTVYWDSTSKTFKFLASEDRNYQVQLDIQIDISNLITSLLGTNVLKVQWRAVIPNGRGAGLDFTFPFPGQDGGNGYSEFAAGVNLVASQRMQTVTNVFANSQIRSGGLGLDVRLSAAPAAGTITMPLATCFVYGR